MIYTLDISKKSPGAAKWTNDGELLDVIYLTYDNVGRDLNVWQNIHINKTDTSSNGKSVEEDFKDKWRTLRYIWNKIEYFFEDVDLLIVEGGAFAGKGRVADLANTSGSYIGNIMSRFDCNVIEWAPKYIKAKFVEGTRFNGAADKVALRTVLKQKYPEIESILMEIEKQGKITRARKYKTPMEDIVDCIAIGKVYFESLKLEGENKDGKE